MAHKRKLTDEQIVGVVKQLEAGRTAAEMARIGVSTYTIYSWKARFGGLAGALGGYGAATTPLQNYSTVWNSIPADQQDQIKRNYSTLEIKDGNQCQQHYDIGYDPKQRAPSRECHLRFGSGLPFERSQSEHRSRRAEQDQRGEFDLNLKHAGQQQAACLGT